MKQVLENLIKELGTRNNNISIDTIKELVTKRVTEYIKGKCTPSEKGLSITFLNKISKMKDKNEMLIYISNTMFNLAGMNA